jgi:hypothetical protein
MGLSISAVRETRFSVDHHKGFHYADHSFNSLDSSRKKENGKLSLGY